jgi:hypothetical protein
MYYLERIINLAINGFKATFTEISDIVNKIRKYSHCYYLGCTKVVEGEKTVSAQRLPKSPNV